MMYWDEGDTIITVRLSHNSYVCRIAYASFSLGYGMDVPPLDLVGVPKPSYHRCRIVFDCDKTFLLDVWTEVNLADPSEDPCQ